MMELQAGLLELAWGGGTFLYQGCWQRWGKGEESWGNFVIHYPVHNIWFFMGYSSFPPSGSIYEIQGPVMRFKQEKAKKRLNV